MKAMKRAVLVLLLILFAALGIGFLLLIWMDMRNGHVIRSAHPPVESHRRREERGASRPDQTSKNQSDRKDACSSIGVTCASQYFAAWTWPADGSCQARLRNGYPEPDPRCTPGGVAPGITAETLSDPSWRTQCIRNCQSSETQKRETYAWYAIPRPESNSGKNQTCELDHLVPLELGGADGMGNIWPECGPADVALRERYFKQKDLVEDYLAAKVRSGKMPIEEAQRDIASDWVQFLPPARAHCKQARCDATD
jgi:hypothetical protein